jgi:hypothetical protein
MEEIFDTNQDFDFTKLVLTKPTIVSGGNYFIRIFMKNQYLYIQPPKCQTKQGIQKNGKRFYTDLVFTNENESFIQWIENLEKQCQQCIYQNRETWFDGEMEQQDIEDYFTPILKVYKSGKQYIIRININANMTSSKPAVKIYDEDENDIEFETINDKTNIMTILEVKGIKFSAKSFQIEIDMKQMMVMKPKNLFEKCLLKPKPIGSQGGNGSGGGNNEINENIQLTQIIENGVAMPPLPPSLPSEHLVENQESLPDPSFPISSSTSENESLENILLENKRPVDTESQDFNDKKIVDGMEEIEFNLDEIPNMDTVQIKQRNEVYYQLYKEAKKKAKVARDFALSAYLEAKEIKNKYMLDDLKDSDDSDLDIEFEEDDLEKE